MSNKNEGKSEKQQAALRAKMVADMKNWGYEIPVDMPFEEVADFHQTAKEDIEATAAKAQAAKAEAAPSGMSEKDMLALIDKYMAGVRDKKSAEPGGGLTEEQLVRIMRAVKEEAVNKKGSVNPNYVGAKDVIPRQRFFAPYGYFFLRTKQVAGQPVALPYQIERLAFEKDYPKTITTGGVARKRYTCHLDITNHEVYKWCTGKDIEGNIVGSPDPDFGVRYFLDPQEMVVDGFDIWERLYASHKAGLDGRPYAELLTLAEAECNIPANSNYDKEVLASRVAKKRADKQFHLEKDRVYADREAAKTLSAAMFGQEMPALSV